MGEFTADTDDLETSGRQTLAAAERLGGIDPRDGLLGVNRAMPGAESIGAAARLAGTWQGEREHLSTAVAEFGQNVLASSADYSATDDSASAALNQSGGDLNR